MNGNRGFDVPRGAAGPAAAEERRRSHAAFGDSERAQERDGICGRARPRGRDGETGGGRTVHLVAIFAAGGKIGFYLFIFLPMGFREGRRAGIYG